jgi:hypothetical protein
MAGTDKGHYVVIDQNALKSYVNFMIEIPKDKRGRVKVGYEDKNGKSVIEPIYDSIDIFENGYAIIEQNQKYGLISESGKVLFEPKFYEVGHGEMIVYVDSKYGYIDLEKGKILLPIMYDDIKKNQDEIFLLNLDNKWGSYNLITKMIIEPIYDQLIFDVNQNHQDYLINSKSQNKLGQSCKVNKNLSYDQVHIQPSILSYKVITETNSKYGYVDLKDGKTILPPVYDEIKKNKDGTLLIKGSNKYGNYNPITKQLISPIYEHIEQFTNLKYKIKLNNLFGIVTSDFNSVIEPIYESVEYITENTYTIKKDGRYGIIRSDGKIVIEPKYEAISFYAGIGQYKQNGKLGYVSVNGVELTPPIYDEIKNLYFELSLLDAGIPLDERNQLPLWHLERVKYNGKYGIYNTQANKMIIQSEYDKIEPIRIFNNSLAHQILMPKIAQIASKVPVFEAVKKGIIMDDKIFFDLNGNYIDKL